MVRRYRSWIIGPMFLGLVVSTVVAFYWDDTYVSRATMRITPAGGVRATGGEHRTTQLSQRLEEITTSILSHTNLISLITDPQLNLYVKDRSKGKALEDVASGMANSGGAAVDSNWQLIGVPSYHHVDPEDVGSMAYIHSITLMPKAWRQMIEQRTRKMNVMTKKHGA